MHHHPPPANNPTLTGSGLTDKPYLTTPVRSTPPNGGAMKLLIVPVTCGLFFIGSLISIHLIFVSGPAKKADVAKSRAAEARSLEKKAEHEKETAGYIVDLEKAKGDNAVHIIVAKALSDVATSASSKNNMAPAIGAALLCACCFFGWLKWFKAEKRAQALEHILITHATPQIVECIKISNAVNGQKLLKSA